MCKLTQKRCEKARTQHTRLQRIPVTADHPDKLPRAARALLGSIVGVSEHSFTSMVTINRILCPTDLTMSSDQAVGYALALARAYRAKLIFAYCASSHEIATVESIQKSEVENAISNGRIRELFSGALLHFLSPQEFSELHWDGVLLRSDDVGDSIIEAAADHAADLIVMRSRRRPHRAAILGSTAESVCRNAPCPVFVTHNDQRDWLVATNAIGPKRVLVPYDFSDYAEVALNYALTFARQKTTELHLLHVLPPRASNEPEVAWFPMSGESSYHTATQRLAKAITPEIRVQATVRQTVTQGYAYREILNYAEKNEIDLISIGAHGTGFGIRALFGSNVDRVLRQAPCPVIVARPLKPR